MNLMSIPVWLSIDFDYFVRYLPTFDWGHMESPFFQSGGMWEIRVSGYHSAGGNLRDDMDPDKWARPRVDQFWSVLKQLGYNFDSVRCTAIADSHAVAGPIFNEVGGRAGPPELLISFDAHHDLGYKGWSETKKVIKKEQCSCDMWLCAVLCWFEDLNARIIYPPWHSKEDLAWERKQIKENLPERILSRVKADLFEKRGAVSPLARPPRGQSFDVQALFVCRSGAWVPPWLDTMFNEFVDSIDEELGLSPFAPFAGRGDVDPTEIRTDFDYDRAIRMGEQLKMMMELSRKGFDEMVEEAKKPSDEDDSEKNPVEDFKEGFLRWTKVKGAHGEGILLDEFEIVGEMQGKGFGASRYMEWESKVPKGTLVYIWAAAAEEFWKKMGFVPTFKPPKKVEWYDGQYAPYDYWVDLTAYMVKRVGGPNPDPILRTPKDLGY